MLRTQRVLNALKTNNDPAAFFIEAGFYDMIDRATELANGMDSSTMFRAFFRCVSAHCAAIVAANPELSHLDRAQALAALRALFLSVFDNMAMECIMNSNEKMEAEFKKLFPDLHS